MKKNIFFLEIQKNYLTKKNDYVKKYLKMILPKQKNYFFWQKILQKLFYHKKNLKKNYFVKRILKNLREVILEKKFPFEI